MNRVRMAWNVALLLLAATSLFAGLTLLDASPLSSVLIIVGAMGFLMSPVASLCGGTGRPANLHGKWQSNYTLRRSFRLHDKEKMNVSSKSKL
jgi:hypothetical protein